MIKVILKKKGDYIVGCSFSGHAGYAKYGSDIVCSAVTAQVMMTINGLTDIMNIPLDLRMNDDGGFLDFTFKNFKGEDLERGQILMKTLKLGIESLKIENSKYITLIEEEV